MLYLLLQSFLFIFVFFYSCFPFILFCLFFNPVILSVCFQPGSFSFMIFLMWASYLRFYFFLLPSCALLTRVVSLLLMMSFLNSFISALNYLLYNYLLRLFSLMTLYLVTIFICSKNFFFHSGCFLSILYFPDFFFLLILAFPCKSCAGFDLGWPWPVLA